MAVIRFGYSLHVGDSTLASLAQDDEGERKVHGTFIGLFYKVYYFSAVGGDTHGPQVAIIDCSPRFLKTIH